MNIKITKIDYKKITQYLGIYVGLISLISMGISPYNSFSAFRSFQNRFSTSLRGNMTMIGNTLLTCNISTPNCGQAQNGSLSGSGLNNNSYPLTRVDQDNVSSTNNSSSAYLSLPNNSIVKFAGLYLSGINNSANRRNIGLDTPSLGSYNYFQSDIDDINGNTSSAEYLQYKDVTSLVQLGGNGEYFVTAGALNVANNNYGGWGMVVVYENLNEPFRNIVINDGFMQPDLNLNIIHQITPKSGIVKSNLGIIGFEGDRGNTGDSLSINNKEVINNENPTSNFFNSTISNDLIPKNIQNKPNINNTMGIDIDLIKIDSLLNNNSNSTPLQINTGTDGVFLAVVALAIEFEPPLINITKSLVDSNGELVMPNDEIEFILTVVSQGKDIASNVVLTDTLDDNYQYINNSIKVVSGPNTGSKTDVIDSDVANYDSITKTIKVSIGSFGKMGIGESSIIKFKAKNINYQSNGLVVANKAFVNYSSDIINQNYQSVSNNSVVTTIVPATKLIGKIYYDLNNNGIQEIEEINLEGVTVNIIDIITNNIVATVLSNVNGIWQADVNNGDYQINVVESQGKYVTLNSNNNVVNVKKFVINDAGVDGLNDISDYSISKKGCKILIAGETCEYELIITNEGQGLVRGPIKIIDILPQRLSYIGFNSNNPNWICSYSLQVIVCNFSKELLPLQKINLKILTNVNNF
jgi:uncharacterized repeat protein (TIGR01451 family)